VKSRDDQAVRDALADYRDAGHDPPMSLYIRDPDKTWGEISVANVGRRTVHIEKIAWVAKDGKFRVPGGYIGDPAWLPATIEEGKARDFLIEDSHFAKEGVVAVAAWDGTGRGYYGSFEPSWQGLMLRAKTALRIRPYR
jgi:hypothetical protein